MNRSIRPAWVALGLLGASFGPISQNATATSIDPALRWGFLANGAGYLIIESHAAPAVGVVAVISGGSGSETWSSQGASHFLEHLLFNGTTSRTQEQIYDEIDLLGTYNNASTRNTHVVFMILAPAEHAWDAFAVQTDMLFHSTLPPEKLEKERGIILEELARDISSPTYEEERILDLDLFGPSGYGLPTLGSTTSIETLTREEISSFYDRNYSPNRMTFVLIGDLDPVAAIDSLEARIGTRPARDDVSVPSPGPPDPTGPRISYHVTARDAPRARLSWLGPDPKSCEFLAFRARFQLLCEGQESPLRRALESAWPGATQTLDASLVEYPGFSIQSLDWTMAADVPVEAISERMGDALEAVRSIDLSQDSFEGWKRRTETEEIFLREKPHYYGIYRGDAIAARGLAAVANELPALRSLSLRDLETVAAPLDGDALRVSVLLPASQPAAHAGAEPGPQPTDDSAGGARWNRFVLSNGIPVLARSGPESEILAVHVFVRDRAAREPEGRAGIAELLHTLLGKATQTRPAEALSLGLDRVGAELTTADSPFVPYDDFYSVPEFSYVRFQSLDRYADRALPLLADIVSAPRLEATEFEVAKSALVKRAQQNRSSSRAVLDRSIAEVTRSGRGAGVFGAPETLESITLSELQEFAGHYLDPRGFLLAVASGMPLDSLRGELEASFGAIPVPSVEAGSWAAPLFDPATGELVASATADDAYPSLMERLGSLSSDSWGELEMPASSLPLLLDEVGAEQSQIALIRVLKLEPDQSPTLTIANRLLSDRMAFRVREREGLAYSIGSSIESLGSGTWIWSARAGTRPENSRTVVERFLESTETFLKQPPDATEIRKSAASIRGRGLMRRLTRLNSAYAAGRALLQGEDPDAIDERERGLAQVSADAVGDLVKQLQRAPGFVAVVR